MVLGDIGYYELTKWRAECFERFGGILNLPSATSPWTMVEGKMGGRILDVGAGVSKSLQKYLNLPGDRYFTLDNDPAGEFTYRTFDEIPAGDQFDMVVMSQFMEHLDVATGIQMVRNAYRVLVPGGHLFVSIPNASHPVRYHADVTHLTNWPFNDLYGLFRVCGYEVAGLCRSNKIPLPKNALKRWIVMSVCQGIRIDWCDTLCILGRKPIA